MGKFGASAMRIGLAHWWQVMRETLSFLKGNVFLVLMWPIAAIVFSVLGWYSRETMLPIAAVAILACLGAVVSLRLAWKEYQLDLIRTTYRVATEGGNEGFYMTRPIYDEAGNIADFEVIDCNERGAELVASRREELIGKPVSSIYKEPALSERMKLLREAMQTGYYEGDLKRPHDNFPAQWVHIKLLRHGRHLAVSARDVSAERNHLAELTRRSYEDQLTKLPNRHWMESHLPRALERAATGGSKLALLFIDLDGFKSVNDTMGHAVGDEVLRDAARRLAETVRPHDRIVRFGGDEFIVILEGLRREYEAAEISERILQAFQEHFYLPHGEQSIGVSIGISVFPNDGRDARTLLRNADIAMYSTKVFGRGSYRFYDEKFYESLCTRFARIKDLRHAIDHDEFVMFYQPRVDLSTGTTSSLEALVRWKHPTKGFIPPAEFIPLAEETGLILRLGELVIDHVCAQLALWTKSQEQLVPVSINVSSRQFNQSDIAATLSSALVRHQVAPQLIEIELTESSVMNDGVDAIAAIQKIQGLGMRVLVDDFGTGYSSLSQLQRLHFDGIKVDQSFVRQLGRTREGTAIAHAIITMAHALSLPVVCEGVETLEQVTILRTLHCQEIQGYWVSEPLPASERQLSVALPCP
jgi:diguanylate cyclase (GGDEF)-like protein